MPGYLSVTSSLEKTQQPSPKVSLNPAAVASPASTLLSASTTLPPAASTRRLNSCNSAGEYYLLLILSLIAIAREGFWSSEELF